jgi:DNA-binding transcriptional LysR family regulator
MTTQLSDLSLRELEVFSEVCRLGSVRAAARSLDVEASQVSKTVARLEAKLSESLLIRSQKGVRCTRTGLKVQRLAGAMLDTFREFQKAGSETDETRVVTFGGLSYLNKFILAPELGDLAPAGGGERYRLLDLPPGQIVQSAYMGLFEAALHTTASGFSEVWEATPVGQIRWGLHGRRDHPLTGRATRDSVTAFPFVVPTYWEGQSFAIGDDFCPLPWTKRRAGAEASTADTAARIARFSEQLAFVPDVVGHEAGLARLEVDGWEPVTRDVFLVVDSRKITTGQRSRWARAITARLAAPHG